MSAFRGNFEMPFAGDDDREYFTHSSNLPQQDVPITGGSSYWTDGAHQSFVPDGDVPNMTSRPITTHGDPFAGHGDQYYGGVHSQPYFQPGDDLEGLGRDLMRMEWETVTQALPGSHSCPPPLAQWYGESSYHRRHPSLDHLARRPVQPNECGGFIDLGELSSISILPSQPSTSPMCIGHPEGNVVTCDPSITAAASSPVRPLANNDPVPVPSSTPRPRGERWDRPGAKKTFWCLWMSQEPCLALIAGNRKSVTSHLRNEHDFTCDNKIVACAWDRCMSTMQRRNIPRHIVACHLAIKVPCQRCGMPLSRADANKKHLLSCTGTSPPAVMGASEMDPSVYSGGVDN